MVVGYDSYNITTQIRQKQREIKRNKRKETRIYK